MHSQKSVHPDQTASAELGPVAMVFGLLRLIGLTLSFIVAAPAAGGEAPKSIAQLRAMQFEPSLKTLAELTPEADFNAFLVGYRVSGLQLHALLALPKHSAPPRGFPVVVANHGFHPNPERYGISANGKDSRPGDYYRSIPGMFAKAGFAVLMPDYRGHNISEGLEYTRNSFIASGHYTEDVLALLANLGSLKSLDVDSLFMWGHSMGGEVTLRALLATPRVKAASLWSTVGGDIWEQAYFYSQRQGPSGVDGNAVAKPAMDQLKKDLAKIESVDAWRQRDPMTNLGHLSAPLIIHHAVGDSSTDVHWSLRLAGELYRLEKSYQLHIYPGSMHFFEGEQRLQAAQRDIEFFQAHMRQPPVSQLFNPEPDVCDQSQRVKSCIRSMESRHGRS